MRNPILLAVAAALLVLPLAAAGQANDVVNVTASVLQPLTVDGAQDLRFGSVIPGVGRTVPPSDGVNAGRFDITGEGALEVSLTFDLPTELSTGSDAMPITFDGNSAAYMNGSLATPLDFDPAVGTNAKLDAGAMSVFIGGTVNPAFDQPAGDYNGTVTLTVAYTGS
ncbi:MAG: DUF4402 domain-containing protein [Gemmatimonadota bacterium]